MAMISLDDDPLVLVSDYGLVFESMYFLDGISEHPECWLRRRVTEKLVQAQNSLPQGYCFKIWDGYRKTVIQKRLYDGLYKKLAQLHENWNAERIHRCVREFVCPPTTDPLKAAPHNTGGTVDLTIIDASGNAIAMGTGFDHFDVQAHTFHYKDAAHGTREATYHKNRMLLYDTLVGVGFYNYPEEWWHFSHGDLKWAEHYGKDVLYSSCEMGSLF